MERVLGWDEVVETDAYKALAPDDQNAARQDYFRHGCSTRRSRPREQGAAWGEFDKFSSQYLKAPPPAPQAEVTPTPSGASDDFGASIVQATGAQKDGTTPERSWKEAANDAWISFQKGVLSTISGTVTAAEMASPEGYRRMAGENTPGKQLTDFMQERATQLEYAYSEKRKAQGKQFDATDGMADVALYLAKNPTFVADMVDRERAGHARRRQGGQHRGPHDGCRLAGAGEAYRRRRR
jgi:hypothetical protein